jgi:erythronate-4-phosphate dehydrogenase
MHTPLTFEGQDKTYHLADEVFFESLKQGCVFINASRGGVVDSGALKAAIESERLQAVVLDVWENEPSIDTELLRMVDVGTPHVAGYSLDGKIAGMIMIYNSVCEYFGLQQEFTIENFLPEPAVPKLEIDSDSESEQQAIIEAVREIYSINSDDKRLRQILDEPLDKIGEYFDGLRKNYPVRREFHNTTIVVEDKNSNLAKKLEGIGFKIKSGS